MKLLASLLLVVAACMPEGPPDLGDDGDEVGAQGTDAGAAFEPMGDPRTADVELVTRAGYWWYAADGDDRAEDWRGPDYLEIEHGGWASDWAPFVRAAAPPVTYFRHSFWVEDAGKVASVRLDVRYDDGFVAYVNGREVAASDRETDEYVRFDVPAALLDDGDNQLAVEVYQGDRADLAFDAALTAAVRP